jgi:HK97 family phage prohead protease
MTETLEQQELEQRPAGPLRFRSGAQLGVSFPQRLVEVVVSPYEEPALVEYRGRMVSETIARGAYNGIQRRAGSNGVRANRDHDITRPCGKVIAFHPSRDEGLVAEIKMSKTQLGDETLELCDDGVLGVSAGYLPKNPLTDSEQWQGRNRVRILKAWLGHVAFTAEPAYEGARVLAVRTAGQPPEPERIATPNLDIVRGFLLTDRYERYSPD